MCQDGPIKSNLRFSLGDDALKNYGGIFHFQGSWFLLSNFLKTNLVIPFSFFHSFCFLLFSFLRFPNIFYVM